MDDRYFSPDPAQRRVASDLMPNLPFNQMLQWTMDWTAYQGFTYTRMTHNPNGGEYWIWSGQDFQVALSEEEFPDHTPMSALILTRQ